MEKIRFLATFQLECYWIDLERVWNDWAYLITPISIPHMPKSDCLKQNCVAEINISWLYTRLNHKRWYLYFHVLSSLKFKAICNDHFNSKLCNFGHVNSLVHYFLPRPYLTTLDFPSYFRDHSKLPWSKNSKWYHRLWMSLVHVAIPEYDLGPMLSLFPPPLILKLVKGVKGVK